MRLLVVTNKQTKQKNSKKKHVTHLTCPAPGPKHDFQRRCDFLVHVALLQERARTFIVFFINNNFVKCKHAEYITKV